MDLISFHDLPSLNYESVRLTKHMMTNENAFRTDILNCNYQASRIIHEVMLRTSILERVNSEGSVSFFIFPRETKSMQFLHLCLTCSLIQKCGCSPMDQPLV